MSNNLNLNPHIILSQPRHTHTRPDRRVVRHPLPELLGHLLNRLVVAGDMVRVDAEDLRPALATGVLDVQVDIGECLLDLCG